MESEASDGSPSTAVLSEDTATREVLRDEEIHEAPTPSSGAAVEARDVSPLIYRVRLGDGTTLGPMSYPRLIELFATGNLDAAALIAREHGKFKAASEFSELHRFVSSPALTWGEDLVTDAIDKGQIDRARLPTRLFHLALRRETGALVVRDGTKRKKIFFVEGVPEFVASTDKSELLGEYLIARGQVLRMEVDMALAMLPRFGGRLGDALVGLGVLRPIELFRAIHDQTQSRFVELFTWQRGEIGFARGARSHEETFPLGVDPFDLIGRGVRHGYPAQETEAILKPFEEEVLEPVAVPPVRLDQFRLPERDAMVIEAVAGKTTLRKLMAQLSATDVADPDEVLRAVFLGLCCELLRTPKWIVPPSTMPRRGV